MLNLSGTYSNSTDNVWLSYKSLKVYLSNEPYETPSIITSLTLYFLFGVNVYSILEYSIKECSPILSILPPSLQDEVIV